MYIENTNIENIKLDFKVVNDIMHDHGFVIGESYDYDKAVFDKKVVIKEGTYYVRVFAIATDGDIGANSATVELKKPIIGKHYYPHGVEYGEDEVFPNHLVKSSTQALQALQKDLNALKLHA